MATNSPLVIAIAFARAVNPYISSLLPVKEMGEYPGVGAKHSKRGFSHDIPHDAPRALDVSFGIHT